MSELYTKVKDFIRSKSSEYHNEIIHERLLEKFMPFVLAVKNERPEYDDTQVIEIAYKNIGRVGFRKWYRELFDSINQSVSKDYLQIFKQTLLSLDIIIVFILTALFYMIGHYCYYYLQVTNDNAITIFYFFTFGILLLITIIRFIDFRSLVSKYGKDSIPVYKVSFTTTFQQSMFIFLFIPLSNRLLNISQPSDSSFDKVLIGLSIFIFIVLLLFFVYKNLLKKVKQDYSRSISKY